MQLQLINSSKKIDLSESIFSKNFNEPLIHQVVTAYLAAARSGTKAQKTRSEVRGGGAKPWKQKGSGRARAGTIRSPIWRKGGVVFAAKPRSYVQKVNKKMYRGAFCSILSELIRQDRLKIVESLHIDSHRTKDFLGLMGQFNLSTQTGYVLMVDVLISEKLYLSSRNLSNVLFVDVSSLAQDPVSLLRADHILITEEAIKRLEEVLS